MSKIYFLETDGESLSEEEIPERVKEFYPEKFDPNDKVAMKLHFGERKSDTHLDPDLVKAIYNGLESDVERMVLMDCTVVYVGDRALASTHKEVAKDNGFDFAPVVIADGERGKEIMMVEVEGKHFDEVKIGKELKDYNMLLAVSHFTGHPITGFGGALKNIGMGLGAKEGKLEMHEAFDLEVDGEECNVCGTCVEVCPGDAISLQEDHAVINLDDCLGCGECIAVCPTGAVEIPVEDASSLRLQERIVEYATGVLKDRKSLFVSVLFDITELCDCINEEQHPMMEDVGILISEDPVAIDQASLDLVGEDEFDWDIDPNIQLRYAEELGLGEREYDLERF